MRSQFAKRSLLPTLTALLLGAAAPGLAGAQDFTTDFDRERCTFATTGSNPYFPLWPGYGLLLEGEEEDEGEIIEVEALVTVTSDTELVDGVLTRVVEERESEDGELVEVSRNFMAHCRETGDVWYFGEDVDDYEDGEIVSHEGVWRAGVDGARPGLIMPGTPILGARFHQEIAPGVAEDRGEVTGLGGTATVEAGTFENVLSIVDTNPLSQGGGSGDLKRYAHGVGIISDEDLELTEITEPPCQPDETTHCLSNGRFRVTAEWETAAGESGDGHAILPSSDSGEFWFFGSGNTELLVKVLDVCADPQFRNFWVFVAGLTDVEVTVTVTDTTSGQVKVYGNDLGEAFAPVLDTAAFATCP
jgi:hypothetical protein